MPPAFYAPVAILSILLCGLPIAACIAATGERRGVVLFLHSFLAGILALALACQAGWTAGVNVHRATPWIAGIIVLANLATVPVWRRVRSLGIEWSHTSGLSAFVVVAVLANAAYLVNDGKPYYGRAWGDQLNYSQLAHYLRVGPPPTDAMYTRPALATVHDGTLLTDRIGQSLLHAWVAEVTGGPELETFHTTCVLAMLATTAVAFFIGIGIGVPASASAVLAVAVAMAPPTQAIMLESFLSQALGTPFVLYAVVVSSLWLSTTHVVWLALVSAATTWVCMAYFEFLPLVFGAVLALLVGSGIMERRRQGSYWLLVAALGGGLVVGLAFNSHVASLIMRIGGLPGFEKFFPFAYTTEGITRLMLGDAIAHLGYAWNLAAAAGTLALTTVGVAGLVLAARRPNTLALPVLALLIAPWAVRVLPGEHSYQFYKLLQSFWPYVWIGLGTLTATPAPWLLMTATERTRVTAAVGLILVTIVASLQMVVVEATGTSPRSGINAYLRMYGTREMLALFAERRESNLVVSVPDRRVYQDGLFNGVASLQLDGRFERIQAKWMATSIERYRRSAPAAVPDDPSTPNVRSLDAAVSDNLRDLLVLQIGSSYLRPDSSLFEEIAVDRRMHVFHAVGSSWLLARTILPQAAGPTDTRDERIAVGNHPPQYVRLDLESATARPEGVGITVRYRRLGGSAPRFWHVYSDHPYGTTIEAPQDGSSETEVVLSSGPIRAGVTQIYFGPRLTADASLVEPTNESATITSIVYGGVPPRR